MILSRVFPSSPDTTGIRCDLHMIFCLLHMLFLLLAGFNCNTQDVGDLFWNFSRTRPEKQQKSTNAEWASAGDEVGSKQVPRGISWAIGILRDRRPDGRIGARRTGVSAFPYSCLRMFSGTTSRRLSRMMSTMVEE